MVYEEFIDLLFIYFYYYENFSSCPFCKQLLPEDIKCVFLIKIESSEQGKVATQKFLVFKSCIILNFCLEYYIPAIEKSFFFCIFTFLAVTTVQVN